MSSLSINVGNLGIVIYNQKYMLVSTPGSRYTVTENLVISWVLGLSFVLMRWLWVGSWVRADHGKYPWLKAWNFQPHPSFSWEGTKTENGVNDWLCLCVKAFIKIPKLVLKSFRVGELLEMLREWCTRRGHGRSPPLPTYLVLFISSI